MDTREVFWTQELQWAINDIQDGVEGARITDEISRYWLQQTRNRKPAADDKEQTKLLLKQGFTKAQSDVRWN